ncbi:unnamed protein product [Lepeophtheirus salmonis]|uniref:(salmon louse) hypothetical protein n=1 Tax=Lepeophtheirus salmonis TaxID=72036 RepID=A0A7R8CBD8_LEPSM|nr:unnamed protein product [Lepeophtheirus salmonis]CAF2759614.1 unnamed protein product [Lepeophtheirus salmonis]
MSTDFTSTTIDASTTTTLDYQTTTTYVPTTILPLIPIQNVIYNISESNDKDFPLTLSIHWAQAKTVTSDLRLNKQMISSHDTTHNSETDYNTIHTNTEVDHCKEYSLDIVDNETGFAIIFNDKSRTEVPLNVTSISLIEKQPELSLCDHVDLKIIPMNHEQTYDNAEYSAKFQYIPKVKTEIYSITNHNMFIKFGNDIGCEPVKLSWTNLKSQDVLSSEVSMPQFEIKDLDSCTEYKILITSEKNSNVLFDQTIKSLVGEHAPMEDHEVNVLINKESHCHFLDGPMSTRVCVRNMSYSIGLLIDDTEPTSDIQVDSSFFDFQLSKDEISIKWTGIWPCIKEYRVQLLEDGDTNEKPIFSKDILSSSNMSFYLEISKDLTLINCNSYTFQISTILFDPSSLVLFSKSFKYSNGFFPPIQGLDYSRLGPDFLFEWKKPEYCGLKYYIAEILDQDLNVIYKSLNATESLHLNTANMMPCSEFQLKLSYIGDGESDTESESSSLKFHTLHSEKIPINVKEDFNQIEFSIGPINGSGHCVDYYVLTLCRFDSGSCQEKTIRAESVIQSPSKIVIDGLSSKTSYLYQVTGFNQEGMKVFYDSDHQIDTKSFIKTANLRLLLAKENKIILELKSSLFKDHMDPEYSFIANCIEEKSDESFRQSIKSKPKLVFYDLPMASKFTCGGEVIYQNEVYSFLPLLEISTLEGIPSEPLNIASQNGYSVKISARTTTRNEFSIWSKVYVFRTAPGNPFVPEIVSVQGVSSSKIIVDFDYPCLTSGITRFDVFVTKSITLKKKYHRTLKKRIEVGRKRFIVEGLEGGHNYDVQISARVENCYSKQCLKKSKKEEVFLECAYRCDDGTCINKKWDVRCDFIQDCIDGSDERNCFMQSSKTFPMHQWLLLGIMEKIKSGKCIELSRTCDRKLDCPDGSDEHDCPYWKKSCWSDEFRCLDATCINSRFVCDGIWDCSGGEDERSCDKSSCSSSSEFTCKPRNLHFPHKESICIPLHKYCDGEKDCVDGSDESFDYEFVMETINCKDGSDEHDCRRYDNSSFIPSTTASTTTTTTISSISSSLSNIRPLYDDYEFYDDLESANQIKETQDKVSGLNLRIYPEYQSMSIGSDVVIQCRDESDHRFEVFWTRPQKLPMPKNYQDNGKGRLEIYKLRREEAGVYECKSVNSLVPKGTLGVARAYVHMEYHP